MVSFLNTTNQNTETFNTILKSTNSGGYAKLTKEFLLSFGFVCRKYIMYYENDKISINIHINQFGHVDMFTEKAFPYNSCDPNKKYKVQKDWFHPKTIKEFLDIFNEYKKYIQHNS